MRIAKYVLVRILIWALTIWVGVTAVFILPRLMPADPIEGMIGRLNSKGSQMTVEQIESMRSALRRQFGLEGTVMEQYATSMKRMLSFDFGPSFTLFPTPVTDLIRQYLPYTVGLMLITSLISFVFGNLIGLLAGFKKNRWYSKFLETAAMCIYPIPYFILALILLILCCYLNNWFPLVASMPAKFSLTWDWVSKIVYNSFLPALSLIILGGGWWIISMKSLASNTAEEEYVNYGRLKGLKERTIAYRYVYKNSILTQIRGRKLYHSRRRNLRHRGRIRLRKIHAAQDSLRRSAISAGADGGARGAGISGQRRREPFSGLGRAAQIMVERHLLCASGRDERAQSRVPNRRTVL